jgi:hypothetical protein
MRRALKRGDDLFSLDDIEAGLMSGDLQGHVEGDTWAITQIHQWPRKKAVNVLFVVGSLQNSLKLEAKVETWAKEQEATLLTAVGRGGWWQYRTPNWKIVGNLYSKVI